MRWGSVDSIVGWVTPLLFDLILLCIARKNAMLLLGGSIVSKHQIIGPKDPIVAITMNLILLNFDSLLVLMHEIILTWRVWSYRLPIVIGLASGHARVSRRGLTRAHYLDPSLHIRWAWAMTATNSPFLICNDSSAHSSCSNLSWPLLCITTALSQATATLALIGVYFGKRTHGASRLLLGVRA